MKKYCVFVMIFTIILMLVACSGNEKLEIKNGSYNLVAQDNDIGANIVIDGATFSFSYDLTSSYLPYGKYEIKNDILILKTDDGKYSYKFTIENDDLIFIESSSSSVKVNGNSLSSQIVDGTVFRLDYSNDNQTEHTSNTVEINNAHFVQIGWSGEPISELEFENAEKLALSSEKHIGIKRVTNRVQWIEIFDIIENSENMSVNLDEDTSFEKIFNKYGNNYFIQNNLLVVSMSSSQLEYSYSVSKTWIGEDSTLTVYIDEIVPEIGSEAMADWIGVLEIKKDYFTEDTKLDAVIEDIY